MSITKKISSVRHSVFCPGIGMLLLVSSLVLPTVTLADGYEDYYRQMQNSAYSGSLQAGGDHLNSGAAAYAGEYAGSYEPAGDSSEHANAEAAEDVLPGYRPTNPTGNYWAAPGDAEVYRQQMMNSQPCRVPADMEPMTSGTGSIEDPQRTVSVTGGVRTDEKLYSGNRPPQLGTTVVGQFEVIEHTASTVLKKEHSKFDTKACEWTLSARSTVTTWDVLYERIDPDGFEGWAKATQVHYEADIRQGWEELYTHHKGRLSGESTIEWDFRVIDGIKYGTIKTSSLAPDGRLIIRVHQYQKAEDGTQAIIELSPQAA